MKNALQCQVTFYPESFVIQDLPSRMLIRLGRERNGLYYFEQMKGGQELMLKMSVSASLWHQRLGNLSMYCISVVPSLSISFGEKKTMFFDVVVRQNKHDYLSC